MAFQAQLISEIPTQATVVNPEDLIVVDQGAQHKKVPASLVLPWTVSGTDVYYTEGNAGIGTSSPLDLLHVSGGSIRVQGNNAGSANVGVVSFYDGDGAKTGEVGDASSSDGDIYVTASSGALRLNTGLTSQVYINQAGAVGIGNQAPTAKVDVTSSGVGNTGGYRLTAAGSIIPVALVYQKAEGEGTLELLEANNVRIQLNANDDSYITNPLGIGVESPNTALEVNGVITVSGAGGITASGLIQTTGNLTATGGTINFAGLPTAPGGLASGDLWDNAGVINIIP